MPITLVTGLPGAGKTLWTIDTVKKRAEEENRKVFYYNIRDLKLDWNELSEDECKKWFKLDGGENGGIIVIDESQDIFVPWHNKKTDRPEYFSMMNKHRHFGFDFYLITQEPMLIDSGIRRLVNDHFWITRPTKGESATVKRYTGVYDKHTNRNGEKSLYKHNKEVYDYYSSAEIHTIKRRLPRSIYYFGAAVVAFAGLAWFAVGAVANLGSSDEDESATADLSELIETPALVEDPQDRTPRRSSRYGTIKTGAFAGIPARYVGQVVNYHLFEINRVSITKIELERLGYKVQILNHCLAFISGVMVDCHAGSSEGEGGSAGAERARPPRELF